MLSLLQMCVLNHRSHITPGHHRDTYTQKQKHMIYFADKQVKSKIWHRFGNVALERELRLTLIIVKVLVCKVTCVTFFVGTFISNFGTMFCCVEVRVRYHAGWQEHRDHGHKMLKIASWRKQKCWSCCLDLWGMIWMPRWKGKRENWKGPLSKKKVQMDVEMVGKSTLTMCTESRKVLITGVKI